MFLCLGDSHYKAMIISYKSTKISQHFPSFSSCVQRVHALLPTDYAGIMLDAFAILLCSGMIGSSLTPAGVVKKL